MRITVNNIHGNLKFELEKTCTLVEVNQQPKGVFLEWSKSGTVTFPKQTEIIEMCVKKKIPMIVFDKYHEITDEEVSYLVGNGAFLWEPSVNNRSFFSYQPIWGKIPEFGDMKIHEYVGGIDLAYLSSLSKKIQSFKDYYQPISEIGSYRVVYIDSMASDTIIKKVTDMGITINNLPQGPIKSTILLGSEHDYQIGNLDHRLFFYLENGIVPMLPKEHRWFHSIFGDLVVEREEDVEYILKLHDKIAFGCIHDVYRNLDIYLPECNVENVAKRIVKYFV